MTTRSTFQPVAYLEVLKHIALDPPSTNTLDSSMVRMIQNYLDQPAEKDAVSVWNFYKEFLDMLVYTSGGNGFMVAMSDLERFMKAPEGAFSQEAGTMDKAPWRQKLS